MVAPNMPVSKRGRPVDCEDRNGWRKLDEWLVWVLSASLLMQSSLFDPVVSYHSRLYRAGEAMVLHQNSPKREAWERLKETNPFLRKVGELRQAYDESENPVVSSVRTVTETIGSWFDENETAQVMRLMKNMDPDFSREAFERELREYIVPEVVDAYLSADQEALKAWCGEAVR